MPKTIVDTHVDLYPESAWALADELGITRSLSAKERDAIDDADFAWPEEHKYPIDTQAHLDAAATLIGRAPENLQDKIKARAITIAKRNKLDLPETWKEDDNARTDTPDTLRIASDGSHDPFQGTHEHSHHAYNEQGGDATHEHSHSHQNDSDHHHDHSQRSDEPDITRTMPSELQFYAPIIRIDKARREVIVRATSEAEDSYGTVFDFEGSKEAFTRWRGNIREMHDPHKAVGRALKWEPVQGAKAVDVILRVSGGAEDTWQKLIEDPPTLTGASIGARNGVWEKRMINGREVPVLTRYDLVELSLVDNPSNPDCTIQIVRSADDAGHFETTEVLETPEEAAPVVRTDPEPEPEETAHETPEETRIGKSISSANAGKIHESVLHNAQALRTSVDLCNCPTCQALSLALDPDQDGDIDLIPELDTDGDGGLPNAPAAPDASGTAASVSVLIDAMLASAKADIIRTARESFDSHLKPAAQRLHAVSSRLSQPPDPDTTLSTQTTEITRRLDTLESLKIEVSEARSLLSEVKAITESYANRAAIGGPMINTAYARGASMPPSLSPQFLAHNVLAPFVELLIKNNVIRDHEAQINANIIMQEIANTIAGVK